MSDIQSLAAFIERHPRLFVLTGAGCSTDSGIPDYRDHNGEWKRPSPIQYQAFVGDELQRKRYWARSLIGWRQISAAQPNAAHRSLAQLEALGRIGMLVTQNVDGLHQAAGSCSVIDLHGRLDTIRCLSCDALTPRAHMQSQLELHNPRIATLEARPAPDGDADLDQADFSDIAVPDCGECSGMLKPDVVFFGEKVTDDRVQEAMTSIAASDAVLIVGSSLMVWSGYRFAKAAASAGKPIAAINRGRTRADDIVDIKIEADCGDTLGSLLRAVASVG